MWQISKEYVHWRHKMKQNMFNSIFDSRTYVHMLPYRNCFSEWVFIKMRQRSSTKKITTPFSLVENDTQTYWEHDINKEVAEHIFLRAPWFLDTVTLGWPPPPWMRISPERNAPFHWPWEFLPLHTSPHYSGDFGFVPTPLRRSKSQPYYK